MTFAGGAKGIFKMAASENQWYDRMMENYLQIR